MEEMPTVGVLVQVAADRLRWHLSMLPQLTAFVIGLFDERTIFANR